MPIVENQLENLLTANLKDKFRDKFSKSKYDSIIESATVGIAIIDQEGNIEDTNQTYADQIGYEKESVIGSHYSNLFNKESIKIIERLVETLKETDENLMKDTLTIIHPDSSHHILDISISKIRDVEANRGKLMVITEDITDQEDTHAALIQSEKLALTGRLAASLAHEINNPLQTSLGCLGLAEEMLGERDDDLRVYIEMAMEELQRSARIVKKLRDLNRKSDLSEKSPVNLKEIMEGVLVLTKNQLYDRSIVPIFPYEGPPPYALASRDQIQQVILNLVINAIDALDEGGNIYLDLLETREPKGYQIKIRDTGKGIPLEMKDNLFDPFFTTKEEGLGLGLYISKRIIEDHDGSISVESEPGKGTAFFIWLPGLDIAETEE
jgi:two-component system sporulation sensor kinase A